MNDDSDATEDSDAMEDSDATEDRGSDASEDRSAGPAGAESVGTGDDDADRESGRAALLERAVVVLSTLLVAGMLGYVLWQATVTPAGAGPSATVEAVEPVPDGDRQRVTVRLENGATGLESVQLGVRCGGRSYTLVFTFVPADGRRSGTVLCPAATVPEVSVETYVET